MMNIHIFKFFILFSLTITPAFTREDSVPLYCENAISNDKPIIVGDRIYCSLTIPSTINSAAKDSSEWKIEANENSEWSAVGPITIDTKSIKAINQLLSFEAVTIQSGQPTIPTILFANKNNNKIQTQPLSLQINSAITEKDKNPLWLLPPIPIGGWNQYFIYSLLIVLLLLLVLLFLLIRKIIRRKNIKNLTITSSYYLEQLAKIQEKIHNENNPDELFGKNICFDLSKLLREYYSFLTKKNIIDLTDIEFISLISENSSLREIKEISAEIIQSTEEIKYNKKIIMKDGLELLIKKYFMLFNLLENKFNPPVKQEPIK